MLSKPYTFLLLGRSGCGKGTQARKLADYYSIKTIISSGKLLRDLIDSQTFAGQQIAHVFAQGELPPDWLVAALWQRVLLDVLITNEEGIIFDGLVRRPEEARVLSSTLEWYNRTLIPILIDINEEESMRRLLKRGRFDDTSENIKNRLAWFTNTYMQSIDFLREKYSVVTVSGLGTYDEVFARIIAAIEAL